MRALLTLLVPYRRRVALAVLLGAAMVASNMGLLAAGAYLIAAASVTHLMALLIVPMYAVRILSATRGTSRYMERLVSHRITFDILARLRVDLFDRLRRNPRRLQGAHSGDTLGTAVADVESLQQGYLLFFTPAAVALTVGVLLTGILWRFSGALAWSTVAYMTLCAVVLPVVVAVLTSRAGRALIEGRGKLNAHLVDSIQGSRDILSNGAAARYLARTDLLGRSVAGAERRLAAVSAGREGAADLLAHLAMLTALVLAVPLVRTHSIEALYVAVPALLVVAGFEAIRPIGQAAESIGTVRAAAERVMGTGDPMSATARARKSSALSTTQATQLWRTILRSLGLLARAGHAHRTPPGTINDLPLSVSRGMEQDNPIHPRTPHPDVSDGGERVGHAGMAPLRGAATPEPLCRETTSSKAAATAWRHSATVARDGGYAIGFEGVTLRYRPSGRPALEGVAFEVGAGKRVAVVGASGSGKTSLVRVLTRFWEPSEGRIMLGGREVAEYETNALRAAVGVVAQDSYIFNDTVRKNLLLARPEASERELEGALEAAGLLEVVRALPEGLDTWVGEHGQRLSGGERQRLAVARVLLQDTPVVVLDEVTANLDPRTEGTLLDTLYRVTEGRTVLTITHRLIGLERVDEIVVLDRGRVAERGRDETLRAAGGLYRRMLDAQDNMLAL